MSLRHTFTRLRKAQDGASAVEFALVAPMFLALVFSTFEMGWYMTQSILLDHALDKTTRLVRIAKLPGIEHEGFRQRVCDEAGFLAHCERDLVVEMIPITLGSPLPAHDAVCTNRVTEIDPVIRFNPGGRSEIVHIRACLLVDPFTPGIGIGAGLKTDASGATQLVSTAAFLNEPG